MKGISFKTVFVVIIIILIIFGIYTSFEKNKVQNIIMADITSSGETIISKELRIGIIEFDNINPIISNNKNVQDVSRLIFDPLFTISEDYRLKPALATECTRLDDNTYIVKLRENVRWNDGSRFDVDDVVFTIDMLKKLGNETVYYYNVKKISEIEKIDNYTIRIVIDEYTPYYEYNFIFPIMSSKYYNEENFMWADKNINPVGTGKFYISNTEQNRIVLKKNVSNWENNIIQLDTVTLKSYGSLGEVIDAFKTEEIDMFTTSNLDIEDYLNNNQYIEKNYINRNYYYLALNTNSNVLENIEVRQAINSGINKESIVNEIYDGKYKVSHFPLDFGSYAYDPSNAHMSFDENTAKNLLVDNGWEYSSRNWVKWVNNRYLNLELTMIVKKNDRNAVKIANKIREQLERIGMIVEIDELSDGQYQDYINRRKYDLALVDSNYSYGPTVQKYFKDDNISNYSDQEVDYLLNHANITTDETELRNAISKLSEIYNNDVPYVSLCYNTNALIYTNNLKGNINPNSYNLFYGINGWYREYKK